jgi:hypothetical protein
MVDIVFPFRKMSTKADQAHSGNGGECCASHPTRRVRYFSASSAIDAVDGVHEIEIHPNYRSGLGELLLRLNISAEVLFPGLQGFAMPLHDRVRQLHELTEGKAIDVSCIGRAAE